MSPQSEGRPSTERPLRVQDSGNGPRTLPRQKVSESHNRHQSPGTNGRESSDLPKQRLVGVAAIDDETPNEPLPPLPIGGRTTSPTGERTMSPVGGRNGREGELSQEIAMRGISRTDGSAGGNTSGGTSRACSKCGEPLLGKYVRALNGTFHMECFMCRVSWQQTANNRRGAKR